MKIWVKRICGTVAAVLFSFAFISFSCSARDSGAATAFADTRSIPAVSSDSLAAAEALQASFRSVVESVLPSVVELDVIEKTTIQPMSSPFDFFFGIPEGGREPREYEQKGLGSGVIIERKGSTFYVLTNNHVVGSATEISVKLNDGRSFNGKLEGRDEMKDIAVVSFESDDTEIPVAVMGDSSAVQAGDICFAMGTPLGFNSSVTQGIISAIGRSGTGVGNVSEFFQTDAAINRGNSGGPLVNIYGEIIGINTWIASQSGGSEGLGFAIQINNAKKAIDDIINSGKVTYGWLGVSLVDIQDEYKKELGVGGKNGAFASQVYIDSPADKGGIRAGDYIVELNGAAVKSMEQLVRDVADLPAGKTAEFKCIRGGKEVAVSVRIEKRTEDNSSDNTNLWPGFIAYPLTDDIREDLDVGNKVKGIVVTNVLPKSPAAAMRLQNGDIITAVNDKTVRTLSEFYKELSSNKDGEVWFDVYSQGHTIQTGKYKL